MSKYEGCPDCKNCKRKICDRYRDCRKFRKWFCEMWYEVRLPFAKEESKFDFEVDYTDKLFEQGKG